MQDLRDVSVKGNIVMVIALDNSRRNNLHWAECILGHIILFI